MALAVIAIPSGILCSAIKSAVVTPVGRSTKLAAIGAEPSGKLCSESARAITRAEDDGPLPNFIETSFDINKTRENPAMR